VTPDAPHGLFNRAVVLADGESLGIEVLRSGAPLSLELGGRLDGRLEPGARIDVRTQPDIDTGGFAERARRKLGIRDPAVLADFDLAGHKR
jgi:NAD+ kinase